MAIAFRSAGTVQSGSGLTTGTALAVDVSGSSSGDLMIVHVYASNDDTATISTPSGWVKQFTDTGDGTHDLGQKGEQSPEWLGLGAQQRQPNCPLLPLQWN